MMQTFVRRLGPRAFKLPDLTKKWLPETPAKAHLGLLKQRPLSFFIWVTRPQTFPKDPFLATFRIADNLRVIA